MSKGSLVLAGIIVLISLFIGIIYIVRRPKKLKTHTYIVKWKELQAKLRDPDAWVVALIDADSLLNTALKKRKLKGKTMGERLVSAQRLFTNNDSIWHAHNLAKKVIADDSLKLKESDVKEALIAFRDALKDIGALQLVASEPDTKAGKKS